MSNDPENCPHCGVSLVGELMNDGTGRNLKKEIGIEIPEKYDGVWYWQCPECEGEWGGARDYRRDTNYIGEK